MLSLLRKALRKPWILNTLALLAAAVLLWPFILDVFNAWRLGKAGAETGSHAVILEDNAQLFSPEERSGLEREMGQSARYCSVALLTTRDTGRLGHAAYAEQAFDRLFSGTDGILFLIDLDNRELRLQKNDENRLITTALCESVTDNVYRYASAGDYYACAKNAFSQAAALMSGGQIPQPMKHISNLLIALCLGLMLAFWRAYRQNDVNRPEEVYQIYRRAYRSISFSDGKLRRLDWADYAGTLGEILGGIVSGIGEVAGSGGSSGSRSSGGWSSGSRSSGGWSSGSGSSGSRSSGSRSSGGSSRSGSGSSGGSHRF